MDFPVLLRFRRHAAARDAKLHELFPAHAVMRVNADWRLHRAAHTHAIGLIWIKTRRAVRDIQEPSGGGVPVRGHRLVPPICALVLAACISSPGPSSDPSVGTSAARGQAIAARLCSSCHAIGRHDRSPHTEAPPFRNLGDLYPVEDLAESLVEGLMTGHSDMPEFKFTSESAGDFIAYLESIQQPGVHNVKPGG
jgi:mono/diheme cytochrome c family protein